MSKDVRTNVVRDCLEHFKLGNRFTECIYRIMLREQYGYCKGCQYSDRTFPFCYKVRLDKLPIL